MFFFHSLFFFFYSVVLYYYGLCNCHDCILLIGREVKLETTWTNCTLAKEEVKHIILYYLMHRTKLLMTNFSLRIIGNYTVHFPEIKIKWIKSWYFKTSLSTIFSQWGFSWPFHRKVPISLSFTLPLYRYTYKIGTVQLTYTYLFIFCYIPR